MSDRLKRNDLKKARLARKSTEILEFVMTKAFPLAARLKLPAMRVVLEMKSVVFIPDDIEMGIGPGAKLAGYSRGVINRDLPSPDAESWALADAGSHTDFIVVSAASLRQIAPPLRLAGPTTMRILIRLLMGLEHESLHACGFVHGDEMANLLERIHGHILGTAEFTALPTDFQRMLIQDMQADVDYTRTGGTQANRSGPLAAGQRIFCPHEKERERRFKIVMKDWP